MGSRIAKKKEKKKVKLTFKEILKEVLIALIITFIILIFIAPTTVREHSMQPTINDKDVVILNKLLKGEPKIGDIVVFESDMKDESGKDMLLIKRVIGTEGDIITIANNKLYRNGEIIEEDYIYEHCTGEVYNYEVPKGYVYVLGDHREVSRDSREFGAIKEEQIIGEAVLRIFPLKDIGILN